MRKLTEKEMQGIIEKYNETSAERASDGVIKAYGWVTAGFEDYIAALFDDAFSKGFRYALRMVEEGRI